MIEKKDIQTFRQANRILLRAEDYCYVLPHPALRTQISNYTITFPNKDILPDCYTVIPHGCGTLVFSCDRCSLHGDLFGPITRPCVVGGLANQSDMLLIIEFQPAGLFAFTGVSQKELVNQIIPFEMVNAPLNRAILELVERAKSLEELLSLLDRHFLESCLVGCPPALLNANQILIEAMGNISAKELSASVYYGERHLCRMFEHYVGMSAKTFSRMIRINKAIRLMQNPQRSITCASEETGFYDLPHFIHDFQAVCGMTPREYRSSMSDFYSEIAKF